MTLHEAIIIVLKDSGRKMTTTEIADELNRRKLYTKKDSSKITAYQVHGRTKNYPQYFSRDSTTVGLK
jgi:hypothetical protein